MSAPSLYRRHRPRSFDDVVGQEHVVRTLRNAIDQDKVHHAYLFVGSRGTGKTSMAKILAACLNCQGDPNAAASERHVGPTTQPCGRCESCRSIAEATSIDVVEMDAASNNSVDDIRDLRDSVAFAPVGGRHKVYILDEAHMLSSQAWNAFLKTLEEPPPRTIFVLATTEANKVLPTVVDRCHRFDFHRPTPDQLARVLGRVADQESITVGPEAVNLIARHATGSFRDALGTLEQLVTYAGDHIANEDVLNVLGVADAELLFRAMDAVGAGDAAAALGVASDLAAQGRDLKQVIKDLEAHARALLLVLMTGDLPAELRISPDRDGRTVEQARTLTGAAIIRVIDLVAVALAAVSDGADDRTQLELLLVRAALPQIDPQAKALAARIARLEQALAGGAPAAAATGTSTAPAPAHAAPAAAPAPEAAATPAAPAPRAASAPSHDQGAGASETVKPTFARSERAKVGLDAQGPASAPDQAAAQGPASAPDHAADQDQASAQDPGSAENRASDPVPARPEAPAHDRAPVPGPTDHEVHVPAGEARDGAPGAAAPVQGPQSEAPTAPATHDRGSASSEAGGRDSASDPARSAQASPDFSSPAPPAPVPQPPAAAPTPQEPQPPAAAPQAPAPPPAATPVGIGPTDVDELLPTIADQMPGNAVRAALGQAQTVSVSGIDLVLGLPAGKASAARLLNREDSKDAIAAALEELLGVRYVVRAEERAGMAAPEEPVLPEDEVVRRVLAEFEAEEVGDGASGVASPGVEAGEPSEPAPTSTNGES
ncbi:DNA polymerase III subunit gamma/tau [Patulibacter americanus]|uniref:DNA polymerase III subunit gamma/tau n=1 Tax=Patulibacter americanus TaxID=588672 RepID=UPI0003B54B56|nr:DNA polymerase III subunit gamma/tau [Patulibacter americanus]